VNTKTPQSTPRVALDVIAEMANNFVTHWEDDDDSDAQENASHARAAYEHAMPVLRSACNAHDDLVAALQELESGLFYGMTLAEVYNGHGIAIGKMVEKARAALAKAGAL
jgi:hypothetical protein